MSRKLPFEDAFRHKMNDLPLPDEDVSWQKMKELLEEKKRRRLFIFFRNKKVTGAVLLLLLLFCFWLVLSPEGTKKQQAGVDIQNKVENKKILPDEKERVNKNAFTGNNTISQKDSTSSNQSFGQMQSNKASGVLQEDSQLIKNNKTTILVKQPDKSKSQSLIVKTNKNYSANNKTATSTLPTGTEVSNSRFVHQNSSNKQYNTSSIDDVAKHAIDSSSILPLIISPNNIDNQIHPALIVKDSLQQAMNNASAKAIITTKIHPVFFINAGVGLQQQIPVNGQQFNFYNYNGSKTIVSDYIPSLYVKLEKNKRWFLQGEFRYASPHLIKSFSYEQQTKADYNHSSVTTNTSQLRKIFYTEAPVSFNVYIHRTWSVGAGVVYSLLHGVVVSKETAVNNMQSGMQTMEKQVFPVKGFTDSFFYKTKTGILLQTAYDKNRWSIGLRYTKDIQPYLTYTLPNGAKNNKYNASLELLIKYRLFRLAKHRQD